MGLRLLALPLAAVSLAAPVAALPSGLYGTVRRGPTTPVCVIGRPCTAPAKGVRLVFVRSGRAVAGATTDRRGAYRVALRPGTYAVRLATPQRIGGLKPVTARVPRGRYLRLDLSIDTGIR
jgi:hypothetical protein